MQTGESCGRHWPEPCQGYCQYRGDRLSKRQVDMALALAITPDRSPCGCSPCPDCGEAGCCLGGCANEVHGVIVNL